MIVLNRFFRCLMLLQLNLCLSLPIMSLPVLVFNDVLTFINVLLFFSIFRFFNSFLIWLISFRLLSIEDLKFEIEINQMAESNSIEGMIVISLVDAMTS